MRMLKSWAAVFLWMAVIFIVSSIPGEHFYKIEEHHLDKVVHLFEFLVLGFLLIKALLASNLNINLTKIVILSIIIAALYGAMDEWHQHFVPNRTPDIFDFTFDFIGAAIGTLIYKRRIRCR